MLSLDDFKRKHRPPPHIRAFLANRLNLTPEAVSVQESFSWNVDGFLFPSCREQLPPAQTCRLYASALLSEVHMRLFSDQKQFNMTVDDQKIFLEYTENNLEKKINGEVVLPNLDNIRALLDEGKVAVPDAQLFHIVSTDANRKVGEQRPMSRRKLCELIAHYGPIAASVGIKNSWRRHPATTVPSLVLVNTYDKTKPEGELGFHAVIFYGWDKGLPFSFEICENRGDGWGAHGHALCQAGVRVLGHELFAFGMATEDAVESSGNEPDIPPKKEKSKAKWWQIWKFFSKKN